MHQYFKLFPTNYGSSLFRFYSNIPKLASKINQIYGRKFYLTGITDVSSRTLATQSILGMDGFHHRRKKYEHLFFGKENAFFVKMEETLNSPNCQVYGEDLKSMIYLSKNKERELLLLKSLLKKYISSSCGKLTDFHFGPEIMRLFYIYKDPISALELIKSDDMKIIFSQITSYTVLMDNLFCHGHYEEIVTLYHDLLSLKFALLPIPKEPAFLTIAACFKLNTEKSFQEAINILESCISLKLSLDIMFYCFTAAHALNLGKFTTALELLSRPTSSNHILQNLKAMALARNGSPQMAEAMLKDIYGEKKLYSTKLVLHETINIIEISYKEAGIDLSNSKFVKLKQVLEDEGLINYLDLDTVMCENKDDPRLLDKSNYNSHQVRRERRERLAASFMQRDKRKR